MPKRSERHEFSKAFELDNPFDGLDLEDIYKTVQWGNEPNEIIDIDSPEPLVALGYLAKIYFYPSGYNKYNEGDIHLALGANSNLLYMFPRGETYIPKFSTLWIQGSEIKRTDYYSNKGGESCYYYHKHETPYPIIYYHSKVSILIPQEHEGKKSYAVIKEGIVG